MRELYVRCFGTAPNGNSTYEWTHEKNSAGLYEKAQAEIDCGLLNSHFPDRITSEGEEERLIFQNFRVVEIADDQFGIVFRGENRGITSYF